MNPLLWKGGFRVPFCESSIPLQSHDSQVFVSTRLSLYDISALDLFWSSSITDDSEPSILLVGPLLALVNICRDQMFNCEL
jgi:hypothetical protein